MKLGLESLSGSSELFVIYNHYTRHSKVCLLLVFSSLEAQKTNKNFVVHLRYFNFKQKRGRIFTVALGVCGGNF